MYVHCFISSSSTTTTSARDYFVMTPPLESRRRERLLARRLLSIRFAGFPVLLTRRHILYRRTERGFFTRRSSGWVNAPNRIVINVPFVVLRHRLRVKVIPAFDVVLVERPDASWRVFTDVPAV
uniref:Uncharacterized protein n=1 Tax=Ostreococcus mediterraneus TaxID=1486918 RepID=A0A7S0KDG5_9CHLO